MTPRSHMSNSKRIRVQPVFTSGGKREPYSKASYFYYACSDIESSALTKYNLSALLQFVSCTFGSYRTLTLCFTPAKRCAFRRMRQEAVCSLEVIVASVDIVFLALSWLRAPPSHPRHQAIRGERGRSSSSSSSPSAYCQLFSTLGSL